MDNFWLGSNELVIVWKNGRYAVIETYENYAYVFYGSYKECFNYCKNRVVAYEESRF